MFPGKAPDTPFARGVSMLKRSMFTFVAFIVASSAQALSPAPGFKVKSTLSEITTYELPGKDIEINGMPSDFKYEDLTEKEMTEIKSLMTAKQEYGKMFGFADWKSTGHKVIEKNGERVVLIQGTYKNADKKNVNFIEVYWADKAKAGQYLITSDSLALKMDNFSDYLK
jgi:hypothetical protein